ncbi:hypothetical protein BpHYR1_032462 [Brachionus plicatilis]|uniref:Uncharacterized protein n=1 Tax=Brachionus plicatilis TaxID=10195 RepID=A0A3M7SUH6_BRAPC|nr:hypothetical protein BpHYR1_032462 [Brachionus plicatilis]
MEFFFRFLLIVLFSALSVGIRDNISNASPRVSVFTIVDGALPELDADSFILEDIIAALMQFSLPIL